MIARIESLKKQYEQIGEKGPAGLLSPSLLSGVNTTIGRFNSQLSDARVKAQELYMTFQKTKSEADRLRFLNARDDFVRLNDEAERFDRTISKTRRDVLSPANISKRAVERPTRSGAILSRPVDSTQPRLALPDSYIHRCRIEEIFLLLYKGGI